MCKIIFFYHALCTKVTLIIITILTNIGFLHIFFEKTLAKQLQMRYI